MKRIIFISPYFPFGEVGARPQVIRNYLKILSVDLNYKVYLICITDHNIEYNAIPSYLYSFKHFNRPKLPTIFLNLFLNIFSLTKAPAQAYLYWSKKIHSEIEEIQNDFGASIVFCELIRTSLYKIKNVEKHYLDMADLFSKRYYDQYKNLRYGNLAGSSYSNKLPLLFRPFLRVKLIQMFLVFYEYKLIKNYEVRVCKEFDKIFLVSSKEVEALKKNNKSCNIFWLPNGTEQLSKNNPRPFNHESNMIISFLGIMDVPHNEEGVLFFINEIFPKIKQRFPDVIFQIIGKNPTKRILNTVNRNIIVTGYIETLEPYLEKTNLFVVPLLSSTGIQTKIFEAMKYGIPIVATQRVANNFPLEHTLSILSTDNKDRFADICIELLSDWEKSKTIGIRGKEIVKYYYWESISKYLSSAL